MRIRIVVIVIALLLSAFVGAKVTRSQTVECKQTSSTDQGELQRIIDACNSKVSELGTKRNSLTNEIKYMDTQMYVTELEVGRNEVKIGVLKEEILNLDDRIDEIDTTVDKVSEIVTKKVGEIYKKQKSNTMLNLVDVNNLSGFLRSIEYLQKTQENDKQLLLKLQNTKVNFETQKSLREQKQDELTEATAKLEAYKNELVQQQIAKQNLLTQTQNDEKTYQQLLSQAKAQIAGFKSFVASSGSGGVVGANGLGTGYDNSYYSQRDERWAYTTIGGSPETVKEVGCLLTSVAMVLKSKGVDVSPQNIATNHSYFFGSTAYMLYRYQLSLPGGKTGKGIGISEIESYLNNNEPVIVGLNAGSYGTHFIVLKKNDGGDYIMFDPVYGPDKKFSEHYSKGQIFSAEIII